MTSQRRIVAALRKEKPDMVPVITWLNPFTKDAYAWTWEDPSYKKLLDCVKKYGDAYSVYPAWDTCLISRNYKEKRRFKSDSGEELLEIEIETPKGSLTSIRQTKHAGTTLKFWVEDEKDLEKLFSIPWQLQERDFTDFFKNKEILGEKGVINIDFCDPVCALEFIKPEPRAIWSIEKRSLIRNLLDIAFERQMKNLEYYLKNIGSPEIIFHFSGPEYVLPPLMSPKDFDEFVMRYEPKLVEKVHSYGCLAIVHSHGKVNNFLEKFRDMGIDGLNVLEPPPVGDIILSNAKKRIGRNVCLIGNIEYSDLASLSKEEIQEKVKNCIKEAANGGGFILSPSCSCYESPIPQKTAENYITMIKACRKFGKYPLNF